MKNAFKAWSEISRQMAGRFIFLFLDFDGTLAFIAEIPDKAILSEEAKAVLGHLKNSPTCRLTIISGRSIQDIKQRIGLEGIIYAGNHGLEIQGPGIEYSAQLMPRLKAVIEQIKCDLKTNLSGIDGVFLEDKGVCLGIHYRLVKKTEILRLKQIVDDVVGFFLVRGKIKIKKGKKVIEIMPPMEWDKGSAVLWLLEKELKSRTISEETILPIYIGDDSTDEDAFKALKEKGISIAVGKFKNTFARYSLKNTAEVVEFLKKLSELKTSDERII